MKLGIFGVCALAVSMMGCAAETADTSADSQLAPVDHAQQAASSSANPNPGIAPIGASAYGKSYGEWATTWWRWVLSVPAGQNPITDASGASCGVGQSGPVWFLAGNFGGSTQRACDVPAGKALFFPIVNAVWVTWKTDPPMTLQEKRDVIAGAVDGAIVSAEIDGKPVANPLAYRERSPVFDLSLPLDNAFGLTTNECDRGADGLLHCSPNVDDGYYLMIDPLPAGDHTIHFAGGLPAWGFSLDVTYRIHVGR